MKNLFVDTNIVIDLLYKRKGFYEGAQALFTMGDNKLVNLSVSSLTIANTHYLLSKKCKTNEASKILIRLKLLVNVLALDDKILDLALVSDFNDFEDAIQYFSALENSCEAIITRNKRDFKNSLLPVMTADEFLES